MTGDDAMGARIDQMCATQMVWLHLYVSAGPCKNKLNDLAVV